MDSLKSEIAIFAARASGLSGDMLDYAIDSIMQEHEKHNLKDLCEMTAHDALIEYSSGLQAMCGRNVWR